MNKHVFLHVVLEMKCFLTNVTFMMPLVQVDMFLVLASVPFSSIRLFGCGTFRDQLRPKKIGPEGRLSL